MTKVTNIGLQLSASKKTQSSPMNAFVDNNMPPQAQFFGQDQARVPLQYRRQDSHYSLPFHQEDMHRQKSVISDNSNVGAGFNNATDGGKHVPWGNVEGSRASNSQNPSLQLSRVMFQQGPSQGPAASTLAKIQERLNEIRALSSTSKQPTNDESNLTGRPKFQNLDGAVWMTNFSKWWLGPVGVISCNTAFCKFLM